jgi:glycosyltransferase involved in cell wall biosynthesis
MLFRPCRKRQVILTAGRIWDQAKNIGLLARIAPELPWPVLVAGETRHPSGGQVKMDGVQFLGKLSPSELGRKLGQAEIFVLPARYEPFGLCALEAAMSGCALVLGDVPSLREVWGDAAVFVPPESPDRLRAALLKLIGDKALRLQVARRCYRRAAYFTPQRMARNYMDLYTRLISERWYAPEAKPHRPFRQMEIPAFAASR